MVTRTRVTIVRHQWETRKSTGTARIAQLALTFAECWELGCDVSEVDRHLGELPGAWLLYPNGSSATELAVVPENLIVLDGTWAQTRRMFRRLTSLHTVPSLSLPPKTEPPLRLRVSDRAEARSTLEAIADALRLLEGQAVAEPLEGLHRSYVERVLRARGHFDRHLRGEASASGTRSTAAPGR